MNRLIDGIRNTSFSIGEIEFNAVDILVSILATILLAFAGFGIGNSIANKIDNENLVYNQALKIDNDTEMFRYGMDTNAGNAFVHGHISTVNPVSIPDIDGEYSYIKKTLEKYESYRAKEYYYETEYYTDSNGNRKSKKVRKWRYVTKWKWFEKDSEEWSADTVEFCGQQFNKYVVSPWGYNTYKADTIKEDSRTRYVYRVSGTDFDATIYAKLMNGTINDVQTYFDRSIQEVYEASLVDSDVSVKIFWIFWIILLITVDGLLIYYIDFR